MVLLLWSGVASAEARFVAVDIFIQTHSPLAAWQFSFTKSSGGMQVVGVENGDNDAFDNAPHFDRDAVNEGRADRIVVADYTLADVSQLPSGRVRVATLHIMLAGEDVPEFDTRLIVAASHGGQQINAEISYEIAGGNNK